MLNDVEFRALYRQRSFLASDGEGTDLHSNCLNCFECWKGIEHAKPLGQSKQAQIHRPLVGNQYSNTRFVVVGENMHDYGGYKALYELYDLGSPELLQGKRRIRFGEREYKGTTLWHRLGCYGHIVNQIVNERITTPFQDFPTGDEVLRGFDHITFLNYVKCSPVANHVYRSNANNAMWTFCGKHVLLEELKILKPHLILALRHRTFWSMLNTEVVRQKIESPTSQGCVLSIESTLDGARVILFGIPHPSQGVGAQKRALQDFATALCATHVQ